MTGFCRHPECVENATYILYHFPGDGFKYSIPHCENHKRWATEVMEEAMAANNICRKREGNRGEDDN